MHCWGKYAVLLIETAVKNTRGPGFRAISPDADGQAGKTDSVAARGAGDPPLPPRGSLASAPAARPHLQILKEKPEI